MLQFQHCCCVSVAVCKQLSEDRVGGQLRGLHGAKLQVCWGLPGGYGTLVDTQDAGRFQGEEPSLQGPLSPACRDGNASVIVSFRLHFLLLALRSLDLGLEQELLQQGLRARLQGHGIPLAAHGTIMSAKLTGK